MRAPKRAVQPRVALALRVLLEGRHRGRAAAATWETLKAELEVEGLFISTPRRLQEAAQYLRRVEKVAIGATSQGGVYLIVDAADQKLAVGERLKRLQAEVEEIAALDVALHEALAIALLRVISCGAGEAPTTTTDTDCAAPEQRGEPAENPQGSAAAGPAIEVGRHAGEGGHHPLPSSPAPANRPVFAARPTQLGLLGRLG